MNRRVLNNVNGEKKYEVKVDADENWTGRRLKITKIKIN